MTMNKKSKIEIDLEIAEEHGFKLGIESLNLPVIKQAKLQAGGLIVSNLLVEGLSARHFSIQIQKENQTIICLEFTADEEQLVQSNLQSYSLSRLASHYHELLGQSFVLLAHPLLVQEFFLVPHVEQFSA